MDESGVTVKTYVRGLIDLAIKLIVRPAGFFQAMPRVGGFIDPLLYVVATAVLGVLLGAVELFVSHGVGMRDLGMLAIWLVIVPLIAVILSFFVAAVGFAIWSFTGSRQSYETSYRCLAYMHVVWPAAVLLSVVPYLGLLGIAWWLFLIATATSVVHKTTLWPALLAFCVVAAVPGLAYYSSVSSDIRAKEHLESYTRELQKMPTKSDLGNARSR